MRVYNVSSGPAKIPEEVLRQASEDMASWRGEGCSMRASIYDTMPVERVFALVDFMQHFERRRG